jgi:capsular polysaccharide biosynthesis protein
LVNKNAPKYVHDFLESIPNRIEYTDKFFVAEKLASVTRGDDVGWPLASDINVLLEFFSSERRSAEGRKLYISRKNSSRSPANENRVEEVLQGRGFEIVQTEDLHLREAINLISTADVLMGPHGAGLSGQVWMKSGSRCIDLAASTYWTEDIYRLSAILNHNYVPFIYGTETQDEVNIENLVDFLVLNKL